MPPVTRRIALVVGPTAGHVHPAIAIADAYRAAFPDVAVVFVGAPSGPALRLLAARGITLETVSASPIAGAGLASRLTAVANVVPTIVQARRVLRKHETRLAIGVGGYASGGVLLAARSLGARTVIHEANVVPGLANYLLARVAHRVHQGLASRSADVAGRGRVVTGHPVRAEIAALAEAMPTAPSQPGTVRVFVTGGSRGGRFLAEHVPDLVARIGQLGVAIEVLHHAGDIDADVVRDVYRAHGVKVTVAADFADMAQVYRWAHFVIARAGAGTLAELATAALPALLVPLADAAGDHQSHNARLFGEDGAAMWAREAAWQADELAARVAALLGDAGAWRAASRAARALATPDAAARIVADCERLMSGRW